ncbi:MAG: T9SS type A sorting domain-containing protein [Flavobacteriales bacterium]|nr:T9SS type A sorting domain-containing protein [Flavobacteriales bacterium]
MSLRYTLKLVSFLIIGAIPFRGLAQGDTCTTALQVVSGIHLANGPSTGYAGPGCGTGQNGDWYLYTPNFTGTVVVSSCHPLSNMFEHDTYVKVFSGDCSSLTCLGFNDDYVMAGQQCSANSFASYMMLNVTAGTNYYIVWVDAFDSGPFFWELSECAGTVTGVTYRDLNANGARDIGELQVNAMLTINPGGMNSYSGADPYSFCSALGDYTITAAPPQYHTVTPASQSYSVPVQGTQVVGMDFGFQPVPGIYDAAVNLWGQNAWIGNNTHLYVGYENLGSEPVNAAITLTLDLALSFVSASVAPTSVSGQTITWALPTLPPFSEGIIDVTVFTSITTAPQAPVLNYVVLTTTEVDIDITNNLDDQHATAVTAIDPNDKHVSATSITPDDVADQKLLEYTINFQNTGTAPAVNIVIKDSLDADWDLSTFEMIGATHPFTLTITEEVAIWTFAEIMLPDSTTDEPNSHGSIHYRMAPKNSLVLGDQLTNRADIYFDYNAPVLTNTTVTTVELSTGMADSGMGSGLLIAPSPSTGMVNMHWSDVHAGNAQLNVHDALGRVVFTMSIASGSNARSIDLGFLPAGSYVARLNSGAEAWARFAIQH